MSGCIRVQSDLCDAQAPVAAGAAFGGFAQGLSGFAFGLIALSIWVWVLDPTESRRSSSSGRSPGSLRRRASSAAPGSRRSSCRLSPADAVSAGSAGSWAAWGGSPVPHPFCGHGSRLGPAHTARRLPDVQAVHALPDDDRLCVFGRRHDRPAVAACRYAAGMFVASRIGSRLYYRISDGPSAAPFSDSWRPPASSS